MNFSIGQTVKLAETEFHKARLGVVKSIDSEGNYLVIFDSAGQNPELCKEEHLSEYDPANLPQTARGPQNPPRQQGQFYQDPNAIAENQYYESTNGRDQEDVPYDTRSS